MNGNTKVTSIATSNGTLAVGTSTGKISCFKITDFTDEKRKIRPIRHLRNGHAGGVIIWTVQLVGARIFSGGSDGLLVIQDFWGEPIKTSNLHADEERDPGGTV